MSTLAETTGKTIKESFDVFNANNPEVYNLFEMKAIMASKMGKKKISSKLIVNVIRWEAFLDTEDSVSTFKINDAYTSHYARLFAINNPTLRSLFNYRELRDSSDEHTLSSGVKLKELLDIEAFGVTSETPAGEVRFGSRKLS